MTQQEKFQTWQVNKPASWLDHYDLSITPNTWYSGRYGHPRYSGLVTRRVRTTYFIWWIMEHGLLVLAAPHAERHNMNLHPGPLAVGMVQLNDRERFRPKYWLKNVAGTNVNALRMGFHLPWHDNCGYWKYPSVRMCIRPWTTHVHRIRFVQPSAEETTW